MSHDLTAVRLDQFYPHPPAKVWRALTEPDLIARWLMPVEGFRLEAGCTYVMQGTPRAVPRACGVCTMCAWPG